jgi:TatA/E family protein of Tat protein translocase
MHCEEEERMFGLGVPELIIILAVALVIFGPGKLPEIGSALGRGIRDFKKSLDGSEESKDEQKQLKDEQS